MSKVDERFIERLDHHALKNIQGGKVEDGQVTEAYHLTKEQWEGLPICPFVMFPANNATDINQVPADRRLTLRAPARYVNVHEAHPDREDERLCGPGL